MVGSTIDEIIGRYDELYSEIQQFDRNESRWWVEARRIVGDIGNLEQKAKGALFNYDYGLANSVDNFWSKTIDQIIEEGNLPQPLYSNARRNVLNYAHEKGVYDEIPSLKERIKKHPSVIISDLLTKSAVPFSFIYYGSKYIKENKLSKKEKQEVYVRTAFAELCKFLGYSLIILSCMYGNPSCNPEKDMDKKDNRPKIILQDKFFRDTI